LLDAEVRLKAGIFDCEYPLIIRADELKAFREAVARLNSFDSEEASVTGAKYTRYSSLPFRDSIQVQANNRATANHLN
jgi:hypothetical protein